jgi:ABC-type uncharacterized transport system involved in gliding motility auxiliary subunit
LNSSDLKFTELVSTSDRTGTVRYDQIVERGFMGPPRMNPDLPLLERPSHEKYSMAAQIKGKLKPTDPHAEIPHGANPHGSIPKADLQMSDEPAGEAAEAKADAEPKAEEPKAEEAKPAEEKAGDAKAAETKAPETKAAETKSADAKPAEPEINVVVVGDIDCLYGAFFALRARGEDPDNEFDFKFDNVPFVLNVLDVLAGDDRFVEIRTRRPSHRTLSEVAKRTEAAREAADKARQKFNEKFENTRMKEQKEFDDRLAELKKRPGVNPQQQMIEILQAQQVGQRRLDTKLETLKQERDREIKKSERDLAVKVREVQDNYKLWAVLLPPIPPLIVAFIVFFNRRANEREGVSKARLR